jgi:hypothetical protein
MKLDLQIGQEIVLVVPALPTSVPIPRLFKCVLE